MAVLENKKYTWDVIIKKFFDQGILKGEPSTFLDVLSADNFDTNYRSINNTYNEYVLKKGEIDEKLFLAADEFGVDNYGGRRFKTPSVDDTPLSQRQSRLNNRNQSSDAMLELQKSPLSTATDSIKRLNDALGDGRYNGSPPNSLISIFK